MPQDSISCGSIWVDSACLKMGRKYVPNSGSSWGVPRNIPKWCQNGTSLANWPESILSTRTTRKKGSVFAEGVWDSKCRIA